MGDARLDKYATQNSKSEYFGIRLGIKGLEEEGFSDAYKAFVSRPNLTETSPAILATAAETILLEAEAALRGWDVNWVRAPLRACMKRVYGHRSNNGEPLWAII